jgi:UDP-GlcNAc:undecaprenyl-phosphate GlcNAc-1-phosphate transferase
MQMLLNLIFAGAVLGFLRFNWSPSSVFMGDAGSLCLGFVLGFMAIAMSQGEGAVFSPVVPLLVLAVPITDTLMVMSKRIIKGRSPFQPDRYHFHHVLMRYGMGREAAVRTILGISVLMSGITLLVPLYRPAEYVLFGIFMLYFAGYALVSFFIVSLMKLRFKHRRRKGNACEINGKRGHGIGTVVRYLLKGLDYAKILRKDPRYEVQVIMRCRLPDGGGQSDGRVENVSLHGCMAVVPELRSLHHHLEVELLLPLDDKVHIVVIQAEHIWLSETTNGWYHGFRFLEVEPAKKEVYDLFLYRCRRHEKKESIIH